MNTISIVNVSLFFLFYPLVLHMSNNSIEDNLHLLQGYPPLPPPLGGLREQAGSERMNGNDLSLILSLFAWSVDTLWSLVSVWQRISGDAVPVPTEVWAVHVFTSTLRLHKHKQKVRLEQTKVSSDTAGRNEPVFCILRSAFAHFKWHFHVLKYWKYWSSTLGNRD